MKTRWAVGGLAIALILLSGTALEAQRRLPGAAEASSGRPISPFFEGWYENADGTYTLSFGYFNRDSEEALNIPIGADNFIEPSEFNGVQPTLLSTRRHVGTFTVTVPAEFGSDEGRVVWTLRNRGVTHSVPGRPGVAAYQLHFYPMAMGSLPPVLRLSPDAPELWGVMTHDGDPRETSTWGGEDPVGSVTNPLSLTASVGTPLSLTVWTGDRTEPGAERDPVDAGLTWFTHQGPAMADFAVMEPAQGEDSGAGGGGGFGPRRGPDSLVIPRESDGHGTVTATFSAPGEYVLRVRADNFNPVDSSAGDQCCWTNGYIAVAVSQ